MKKRSEGEWQTSITVDLIWSELWNMFFKLVEWNYIASETCWGPGTDDLSLCSVAFFYYPFSISEHKCEAGAGKRGFREEGTERWSQGSLLNIFPKGMSANWKRGNNKHWNFEFLGYTKPQVHHLQIWHQTHTYCHQYEYERLLINCLFCSKISTKLAIAVYCWQKPL